MTMLGNEQDCICHKPKGKHLKYCDAYRLSEFMKKLACVKIDEGGLRMTKTTKKEYEEEKYKTIQRLKFEIKELKELNIDLQLRFKDTFSQSDLEQLRQECLLDTELLCETDDEVRMAQKIRSKLIRTFAKYGVGTLDKNTSGNLLAVESTPCIKGSKPSNPNKCPKCDGRKYLPLFDARGNVDGGEMCSCVFKLDKEE